MNTPLQDGGDRPYITLKREPFVMDRVTVILQNGRLFDIEWKKKDIFLHLHQLTIPELAWDALFNFNEIHVYPAGLGLPKGRVDIQ